MSNPAGRLHQILTTCVSHRELNVPCIEGWRVILQMPDNATELAVMAKIGRVFELPDVVANRLNRYPDLDKALFLQWQPALAETLKAIRFNAAFPEFASRLKEPTLLALKFCSHELERREADVDIAPEELTKLRNEAWSLYEEVSNATLDSQLKGYLLRSIYQIISALDDYAIHGSPDLQTAINAVVGSVITAPSEAKKAAGDQIGGKLFKLAAAIGIALKLGKGALELGEGIRRALENGN